MILNVAIGFVTGRKHFQNVLKTYVNNWLEHGLISDSRIRLHLFVAYDLKYFNTRASDYKNIPPEVAQLIDSIQFYGAEEVEEEIKTLKAGGAINDDEAERIFGEGYAKKRNIVTYFALKNKMDKLLFIDDDEYPVAALKNASGKCYWMGQSVVGTHLKYNDDAHITHGRHCGYISPIPFIRFNDVLTENDLGSFIEAISNDIISWDKLKNLIHQHKCVTYADAQIINDSTICQVEEVSGMKFISGANLCFNLKKTKALPPFYNPPGARGEDTFMSTMLSDLKVVKVPCYTFHDGFLTYKNLLNGVIPTDLEAINGNTPANQKRFINAAIGWIRYKPLLVYITRRKDYAGIMEDIRTNLHKSIPKLNAFFKTKDFEKVLIEFERYHRNVVRHFEDFEQTKRVWGKLLKLLAEQNLP
ncbi:MAG: hypothetical protein IT260_09660 [Saprospiraceae bacterium]|nr:hypothetical protein [Saprospiraceae bacterium]